ncbi:Ppx/GppA phosphatase family protein [Salegentibacter mishustinae]|uniref:Exopolyphosphatase n=1 Tax=Salegentibacter mishustinae TaxID=270918 RepID=A0A0Q9ZMZ0_9FLAO|nr:ethanolamine ammonia-lyase reactivating factor EutA [Salegentibacter mishustinae]KRG30231.1 exopolyphosphatase [Salegentibacter mishustinae]PNW19387.1 exopolyphosphatase [Salegentibacter mishustinae]PZX62168.1 exopolyphosphatase/guanosine-5'-triphosphate,3'-diphosphate pyrophosphatase [Salegentibacter mishustinae]GGW93966.1 exopolyphosphatase [Salegentibacter mishustinae]
MITQKNYAAIDIGSNAVRLLVSTITEQKGREDTDFRKTSLVRVPIRLGEDVFEKSMISEKNIERMVDTMQAFNLLMKSHGIEKYKACATSAMREAKNGAEVVEKIKAKTGVEIEIIDGNHEAAIIAATDLHELIKNDCNYLYVDVGGGSTEYTLYSSGKTVASRSFKVGTVRLLNDLIDDGAWEEMEKWVRETTKPYKKIDLIGSGGNINNIFKTSGKKEGKPLSLAYIKKYNDLLNSLSYEERVMDLKLKSDRADVIIPASKIYLSSMKWARADNIFVPKIGLADGIIKSLYNDNNN